tara:strand:- start:212 stop:499 length:288 start_codon:yes stop_codon:yes gene_type:complete
MMFKPVNRYIEVELISSNVQETNTGILLPHSYKPTEERFIKVKIKSWADDARFASSLSADSSAIVDKTMIEELTFDGYKTSVILDNYILGLFTVQ